jgi:copper chaperone CopZ
MIFMANGQDVVLSVPDVSCEHCVRAIDGALSTLSGVEAVSTDIPTKSIHLRYEPNQISHESTPTQLFSPVQSRVLVSRMYEIELIHASDNKGEASILLANWSWSGLICSGEDLE